MHKCAGAITFPFTGPVMQAQAVRESVMPLLR